MLRQSCHLVRTENRRFPIYKGRMQRSGRCTAGMKIGEPVPWRRRLIARRRIRRTKVRTLVGVAGLTGALLVVACTGGERPVDDGLRKDLELASTASPISLQASPQAAQVVSAIERTSPPAPRRAARSQRVVRHVPARRATPQPIEVEEADVNEEVEEAPIHVAEVPIEVASLPSPRPQPVTPSGGGRDVGDIGTSRGDGMGSIIGVVLRGGHAGVDDCDPRVDGRRRGGMAINNRIPVVGTFPGGRIQGTFPGSGRLAASLPRSGRVRF